MGSGAGKHKYEVKARTFHKRLWSSSELPRFAFLFLIFWSHQKTAKFIEKLWTPASSWEDPSGAKTVHVEPKDETAPKFMRSLSPLPEEAESVLNHRWARPSWIPILSSFGFASNWKCYLEHVAISMGKMEFKSIRNNSNPLKSIESWATLFLDMFGQVEIPPKPTPSNDPSVLRSDFSMTWPRKALHSPCSSVRMWVAPIRGCTSSKCRSAQGHVERAVVEMTDERYSADEYVYICYTYIYVCVCTAYNIYMCVCTHSLQ